MQRRIAHHGRRKCRSQCPFEAAGKCDTTRPARGESRPKISFRNKGLMIAIYDVRETKSDIDWF